MLQTMKQKMLQNAPKLLPACREQFRSILEHCLFHALDFMGAISIPVSIPEASHINFEQNICIPSDRSLCVDFGNTNLMEPLVWPPYTEGWSGDGKGEVDQIVQSVCLWCGMYV